MPELFDRLSQVTGEMAQSQGAGKPVFELRSERELEGSDPDERVEVTIQDFRLTRLRIDHLWADRVELADIERHVMAAVNRTLVAYLEAELTEAADAAVDMTTVHQGLRELSADFHAAFVRTVDGLSDRAARA